MANERPPDPRELDPATAARLLATTTFNLIRRGADGSLVLSADRWRLTGQAGDVLRFHAEAAEAPPLELALGTVKRITLEQLPRQRLRSQIRFVLDTGDILTFSGLLGEAEPGT